MTVSIAGILLGKNTSEKDEIYDKSKNFFHSMNFLQDRQKIIDVATMEIKAKN